VKILVAGNSQAGALKLAYDAHPDILGAAGKLYFFVVPGGHGPYLTVRNDRMVVEMAIKDSPPYAAPAETPDMAVSEFDAVVISALGYVDGGFRFDNQITRMAALAEFQPKGEVESAELVSDRCYREMIVQSLRSQHGFRFAKALRENYAGRIIVQPFPYSSEEMLSHEDWGLRQRYADPVGAHRFFSAEKDVALARLGQELTFELLDYPCRDWATDFLTPASLMRSSDCLHPTPEYGAMVLRQIRDRLSR
jgi:hypothetical protein